MGYLSNDMNNLGLVFGARSFEPEPSLVLPSAMVGVEVEIENCRAGMSDIKYPITQYWEVATDGSLRDNGLEFKTNGPLFGKDLITGLYYLKRKLNVYKPSTGYRTGVHIHLDVRDMGLSELMKMVYLYIIYEKALFKLHPGRESNIYCIPLYDSNVDMDKVSLLQKHLNNYNSFNLQALSTFKRLNKYSALNLNKVPTFGTVEFRHMNGCVDTDMILKWINIIFCLKKAAQSDTTFSIETLSQHISSHSPLDFTKEVFNDYYDSIDNPDLVCDMYEGLRAVDFLLNRNSFETV